MPKIKSNIVTYSWKSWKKPLISQPMHEINLVFLTLLFYNSRKWNRWTRWGRIRRKKKEVKTTLLKIFWFSLNREENSGICSIWLSLEELPYFHYIFSICLLICYFGSCSVTTGAVTQIKTELAGSTWLYSSLPVADEGISYLWQLYSTDVLSFFLSYKAVIQNASFIHDTLKMWIKLNFIASEVEIPFVQYSCMTFLYFDCEVTCLLWTSLASSTMINVSSLSFDTEKCIQEVSTVEK